MGIVKKAIGKFSGLKIFHSNVNIAPAYHIVSNEKVSHVRHLYSYKNMDQFEEDLRYLQKHYQVVSPDKFDEFHLKHQKKCIISFDDGLVENYTVILPLLEKYKFKAVFFINPSFIDNTCFLNKHLKSILIEELSKSPNNQTVLGKIGLKNTKNLKTDIFNRELSNDLISDLFDDLGFDFKNYLQKHPVYMNLNQIQELIDKGHFIGGHTMTHPYLNKLSEEEQFVEITDSLLWIKQHFKVSYTLFSFPYSDRFASKQLIRRLENWDNNIIIFGNSGYKKDVSKRIVQRFSAEKPIVPLRNNISTEFIYMYYNKLAGNFKINFQQIYIKD